MNNIDEIYQRPSKKWDYGELVYKYLGNQLREKMTDIFYSSSLEECEAGGTFAYVANLSIAPFGIEFGAWPRWPIGCGYYWFLDINTRYGLPLGRAYQMDLGYLCKKVTEASKRRAAEEAVQALIKLMWDLSSLFDAYAAVFKDVIDKDCGGNAYEYIRKEVAFWMV